MKYEISDNRTKLTLILEDDDRVFLNEIKRVAGNFDSFDLTEELLESLVMDSELSWIDPAETGDLTDAPMLGFYEEDTDFPAASLTSGCVMRVKERWGFMDYQIISLQQRLLDTGKAVLVGGN